MMIVNNTVYHACSIKDTVNSFVWFYNHLKVFSDYDLLDFVFDLSGFLHMQK